MAEYAVLEAVARRLAPGGPRWPGADALGVAARLDRALAHQAPGLRREVGHALRLVELGPLATRLAPFTRLAPGAQDAELAAMAGSRFAWRRSAFRGLRALVVSFRCSQEPAGA